MHGILAAVLAVGMLFITPNEQGEAGTLQYHAGINSSERQSDMIFMCELDQIVDGQEMYYQWQQNSGSGWQNIAGVRFVSSTTVTVLSPSVT